MYAIDELVIPGTRPFAASNITWETILTTSSSGSRKEKSNLMTFAFFRSMAWRSGVTVMVTPLTSSRNRNWFCGASSLLERVMNLRTGALLSRA